MSETIGSNSRPNSSHCVRRTRRKPERFSSWRPGWLGSRWRGDGGRTEGRGWSAMAEHAYESLVRRTYQDCETGDLDLLGVVMAPEVAGHEPERSSLACHNNG